MFFGDWGVDRKKKLSAQYAGKEALLGKAQADFYDESQSDAFKSDLDKRIADIAARKGAGEATAQKTKFGADAYGSAARVAPASTVTGTAIARPDAATRVNQAKTLETLYASMNGGGPSVAPGQQQQSTDAALAAFARARAAKGARANPALASLAASREMGGALHEGGLLAASTRAREANDAAQKFGAMSAAVRGQDLDAATAQAKLNQEAALYSANAWNANALANKAFADQMGQFNASAAVKEAKMAQDVELANMEAALRAKGWNDQQIAQYLSQYQKQMWLDKDAQQAFSEVRRGELENRQKAQFEKDKYATERNQQYMNAIVSTAALLSDERTKRDVRPGTNPLGKLLNSLQPYEYEYKDPSAEGAAPGKHVSVMAQDLERTDLGKSAVKEAPDGTKMVDGGRLAALSFAAIVDMHRRLKAVEARKGK